MNLANSLKRKIGTTAHNDLENREAFVTEPWWSPPRVTIPGSREEAERMHKEIISRADHPLAIYTDGSGINEKVGGSSGRANPGNPRVCLHGQADLHDGVCG
jgi:hypothetical protein